MQYTVTPQDKGKVSIKVDVSKIDFDKAYDKAILDLGKDTKVDGFRPGNVPADVLESKLGTAKVLNEAANILVSRHLAEIFEKEQITPIVNPKVAIDSLSRGEAFSFVAEVSARPKVKLGDWKAIKVKKIGAKEVTEADIEESIKNIFEAWKKQKETKGVSEPKESDESGKFIYDAHGNRIPIKDTEEKKEKETAIDDDFAHSTGAQGEIDDNFAKAIGAQDLNHLKELVKKDLENIVADQVETKFEEEIFDEILKLGEVDVPDILVDDEVNRIMVRINQNLEQQGKKMEDFLQEENTTLDALRAKLRLQAEKNVKITLVMDEIGKEAEIKVTREEIDEASKGVNTTNITPQQKIDLERYLVVSIFQAKTLDLVKKSITAS